MTTTPRTDHYRKEFLAAKESSELISWLLDEFEQTEARLHTIQEDDTFDTFLRLAMDYKALWLICHENMPREPEAGENIKLGQLRGKLFAAIDELVD